MELEEIRQLKKEMTERINHFLTAEFKAFTGKTELEIKEFKLQKVTYSYHQSPPEPIIHVDIKLEGV